MPVAVRAPWGDTWVGAVSAAQRTEQAGRRGAADQDRGGWAGAALEAGTRLWTPGLGWPRAKSGAPAVPEAAPRASQVWPAEAVEAVMSQTRPRYHCHHPE